MEEKSLEAKGPAGWIWVAVIVVLTAGLLFLTQKKAPSDTGTPEPETESIAPVVKDIPVTPSLTFVPPSVPTGALFGMDWQIAASEQTFVSDTGLVWDTVSHPGALDTSIMATTSPYATRQAFVENVLTAVPGTFEDNIKLREAGEQQALYLRVYATVNGKTYWSEEYVIPTEAFGKTSAGGS